MTRPMLLLSFISVFMITVFVFIDFKKTKTIKSLLIKLIVIVGYSFFLNKLICQNNVLISKGGSHNHFLYLFLLYISMIFGMFCQFWYKKYSLPKKERKKLDYATFIRPIFISPLIFMPIMSAFNNIKLDLSNITNGNIMTLFIAFQNGFFWKEILDNRKKDP